MAFSVELRGLSKRYGSTRVLEGIDLAVEPGSVFGYIGPNGAGKTTTVKILVGMLGHYDGAVRVAGRDPAAEPLEFKRRVGYVPENASLYDALTVNEFLHMMDVVERVCDRIAVLSGGRVVADGTFDELASRSEAGGSLERVFVELTAGGEAGDRAQAVLSALERRP